MMSHIFGIRINVSYITSHVFSSTARFGHLILCHIFRCICVIGVCAGNVKGLSSDKALCPQCETFEFTTPGAPYMVREYLSVGTVLSVESTCLIKVG